MKLLLFPDDVGYIRQVKKNRKKVFPILFFFFGYLLCASFVETLAALVT